MNKEVYALLDIKTLNCVKKNFDYIKAAKGRGLSWKEIQRDLQNKAGLYCHLDDLIMYCRLIAAGDELSKKYANQA